MDGTVPMESNYLIILGMSFDAKVTFEKHLRYFQSSNTEAWYHEPLASIP